MNGPPSSMPCVPCRVQITGTPGRAAGGDEPLRRLDHAAHVRDVDPALRVPPVRVQEVALVVDHDERGVAGHELPAGGFEGRRHESSRRF